MDESKLELKVGALMLAALVGLLGLLYLMGELSFGSGHTLTVDFAHTGNVVRGAPVKLGGFVVGRVERIALLADRRERSGEPLPVSMTISLSREALAALRSDVVVTVSSQGPLGEPYLEIWPGSRSDPANVSVALRGVDAPRIDIVSNRLARFLEAASKVLEDDPDAINKLVNGVGSLTTTVDGVVSENREDIRQVVVELGTAAKDLRALSAVARQQLEPGGRASALLDDAAATARVTRAELPELSKKASVALGGLAAVSGQLTEDDGKKLKAMIAKYQEAGETLDGMATRADHLLTRLEAGDGTAGQLLKDKQVYDDLKSLLADLRKHPWKMLWKD